MGKANVSEISVSFVANSGSVYREHEELLIVPVSGRKIESLQSEEALDELKENLEEAFAFLAEEGEVEVSFRNEE